MDLSAQLGRPGAFGTTSSKLRAVMALTWPSVMAQMSNILMEYIDAAMVGRLGAEAAASIGLVATSTWLLWGLTVASCTGFAVQVAHRVGAGDNAGARDVFRRGLVSVLIFGLIVAAVGSAIAYPLPHWLGGTGEMCRGASMYFLIFSLTVPLFCFTFLTTSTLRSSGNMLVPGVVNGVMCVLDVVFNFFLIFPTREMQLAGLDVTMPGAGLGVAGAAIGTSLAYFSGGIYLFIHIVRRSPQLRHPYAGIPWRRRFSIGGPVLRNARNISWPVALERTVMCGAMILVTSIVAPLGNAAIAANSFAVTAESLCYAPGYGVCDAATTLVGQCLGAGKKELARAFARISVFTGMAVMGVLGVVMWVLAPEMMGLFTSDREILDLGTMALRTEAWAEPMFGAAIVTYGIFIGAGYTKVPAALNFSSIWGVRITLSAILAPMYGLFGVWLAMCIELCARGLAFLTALAGKRWLRDSNLTDNAAHQTEAEIGVDSQQEFF